MDDVVAWIRDRNPELARTPAPDEDLIEGRVIDSLAFLEFIYLLEELTGRPIDCRASPSRTSGRWRRSSGASSPGCPHDL